MTDNAAMDNCPILLKFLMVHYMGLVIKAHNDWCDVGQPQVAMHRNYHFLKFVLILFLHANYTQHKRT